MTDKINDKFKQSLQEKISLNRFGLPEDVANAVTFCVQNCQITLLVKQYM